MDRLFTYRWFGGGGREEGGKAPKHHTTVSVRVRERVVAAEPERMGFPPSASPCCLSAEPRVLELPGGLRVVYGQFKQAMHPRRHPDWSIRQSLRHPDWSTREGFRHPDWSTREKVERQFGKPKGGEHQAKWPNISAPFSDGTYFFSTKSSTDYVKRSQAFDCTLFACHV